LRPKLNEWKSWLKADPTEWLLEEENPSVCYLTLMDIWGKPQTNPEVRKAKKAIMERGVVPRILAKQREGGYWGKREDFYVKAKYKGTIWQLIILAELGADGKEEKVRRACEFVLGISQGRQSGGFSYLGTSKEGGFHYAVLPCLTGNMVWSLIKFGYLENPRVQHGIEWISKYQRFDDGEGRAPKGWPYDKREQCLGKHTCYLGIVKALKALAEIPEARRTANVKHVISKGAEYLLCHHLFKRSHNPSQVIKPKWTRFGFPLMWDADALEMTGLLTKLGYRDSRMQEAIDLILSKQDDQGRWTLEETFNGRFQVNIEQKGKPSKWVTLNALRVLKNYVNILNL
jgi:hypothetical protein